MAKSNGIFRYADRSDKLLMFFGTLGSIGDGLQVPLMMYVLSDVINQYGLVSKDRGVSISMHSVNQVPMLMKITVLITWPKPFYV